MSNKIIFSNPLTEIKSNEVLSFRETEKYFEIIFKTSKELYTYKKESVSIVSVADISESGMKRFGYLIKLAEIIGMQNERGVNSLLEQYRSINFIPENNMLAAFLTGKLHAYEKSMKQVFIFPFGYNLSQKKAVERAFSNTLSIIEGPPGTGKTQTILNIIANAIMSGSRVAVVSSAFEAMENVYEKLQKHKFDFIAAKLGNFENIKSFIESQTALPDMSG